MREIAMVPSTASSKIQLRNFIIFLISVQLDHYNLCTITTSLSLFLSLSLSPLSLSLSPLSLFLSQPIMLNAGEEEVHITTSSYKAKNPDELTFERGVLMEVFQKGLDGWWKAR